ncbi:hypothetical protein I312_101208 [Cryptococcus bacillisporus CA1280]|uniref:Ribosome biogenesis protein NOP53 n=1 Tax=Cryptococcus bacillisporus CA1280 TaxID=1296109 RepID=A0A0D0VMB3_CRYGA|nr:nucleolar protein 53 [Cryptococcus bacillisporus CA1280]
MAPRASTRTHAKPYDRPAANSKSKGKGKAAAHDLGAPATHSQSSRKGKKAWRKNIDITHEEEALEKAREDERVTGGPMATKSNNELFTVDVVGDAQVGAKAKRQHKPLRSLAILSERSAVPSLTSRVSKTAPQKKKPLLSSAEKERLKRIARKTQAFSDGTGLASADIKARGPVENDVWEEEQAFEVEGGFGEETIVKKKVKVPLTIARQRAAYLGSVDKAVETPEGGVSYNPSAESHAKLIDEAYKEELAAVEREKEEAALIEKFGSVVEARRHIERSEFAEGMLVGDGESDGEESSGDQDLPEKKASKRKTTAQRNRQARQRAIEEAARQEKEKRKLANSVSSLAAFKREVERKQKEQAEKERIAKLAKKEKERRGKQEGEKVGKYRVQKKRVEVQLGEDLAESLRQVKPEGNLFKDRFLALQKRALVEPRVPQLPKKKALKIKEFEKHAWKRFF